MGSIIVMNDYLISSFEHIKPKKYPGALTFIESLKIRLTDHCP